MIFRHRRALCLSLFTILCTLLAVRLPVVAQGVFGLLALAAAAALFPLALRRRRLRIFLLAALLALLSLVSSLRVSLTRAQVARLDGEELSLTATVLRVTSSEEGTVTADGIARLPAVIGRHSVEVKLRFASEAEIHAGDRILGVARVYASEKDSYGAARGCFATLRFEGVRVTGKAFGLRTAAGRWSEMLSERIRTAVPGEEGALYAALLLGDREGLSDTFTRDMTRIGTVHILSVSGMHLVILTAGIGFLLRRWRLGRRLRLILLSVFAVFFMLVTGLSSSVLRAGFMFLFSALPVFLREERDSLSSLSAAVAVILLLEPYAVGDLGLWLSALSTLGILMLFDRTERKGKQADALALRILRAIAVSAAVTLSASVATLPFSLLSFGSLPLASPIANLLLSPLIQGAMYLSIFLVLLGIPTPLSLLARLLARVIFLLSELLAEIPRTVLVAEEGIATFLPLALFFVIAAYFLFCPRKRFRWRVPLVLLLLCAIALALPPITQRIWRADGLSVTLYSDAGAEADAILLEKNEKRMLIPVSDLSAQSAADTRALRTAAGEIDALLIPYYTAGAADYVLHLLSSEKIRRLYLPMPFSDAERTLASEILAFTNRERIPVVLYPTDAPFTFEGMTVSYVTVGGRADATCLSAEILAKEKVIRYYGANAFRGPEEDARDADLLLFGCFGGIPQRRYRNGECVGEGTHILCPSAAHLPLYDPSGISFSSRGRVILR